MASIGEWLLLIEYEQQRNSREEHLITGTNLSEELMFRIIGVYFQERYEANWKEKLNEETNYKRTNS